MDRTSMNSSAGGSSGRERGSGRRRLAPPRLVPHLRRINTAGGTWAAAASSVREIQAQKPGRRLLMDSVRYRVVDLHCESCSAELGDKLRAVENVVEAAVDPDGKEVRV